MRETVSFLLPFLCGLLLHEGGHFFALLWLRLPLPRFGFTPLGAVLSTLPFSSYRAELAVLAAGPAANLLTVLFCRIFGVAGTLGEVSLFLAALNLLPVAGLDGGGILRAAVSLLGFPALGNTLLRITGRLLSGGLFLLSLLLLLAGSGNLTPLFLSFWMLFRSAES